VGLSNFLEFGFGASNKEENAGRIAYQRFSSSLDIVGAGSNGGFRKVKVWDILNTTFLEADNDLSIQCGSNNNILFGNSVNRACIYASGRGAFLERLNINGGTINENKWGWSMGFDVNSNLGFYRANNQNYLTGSISGSSNVLLLARDGSVVVNNGNLNVNGSLSATSKNFIIPHPLDSSKKLIHASVEAPQLDLIYSGKVKLNKGQAVVDIDSSSCPNSPMTQGTFQKLTRNPRVYLQNNDGFTAVKGMVKGGTLEIQAQSKGSDDVIDWLIVAERRDECVMSSSTTTDEGHLKTEY
jgi:hypothetical protein